MKRLWTPAWIVRHVAMVGLVIGFCGLGWWQVSRAAAGNATSWAYAVEWPIFAAFVVFVWWREVRHALRGEAAPDGGTQTGPGTAAGSAVSGQTAAGSAVPDGPAAGGGVPSGAESASAGSTTPAVRRPVRVVRATVTAGDGDDTDLAEYNRYLRWLNANPGARPGDYPG